MLLARRVRLVAVVLAYAASAAAVVRLPASLPVDLVLPQWTWRWIVAFFLPTVAVCLWLLARALARRDPLPSRYGAGRATWEVVLTAAVVFVVGLHLVALATALSPRPSYGRALPLLLGVLMVIVGNVLPRLRPNHAFGVRTPWALADARVWARTHRAGGYLVAAWGVAMVVLALAAPTAAFWAMIGGMVLAPAALVALSFAFSRTGADPAAPVRPPRS